MIRAAGAIASAIMCSTARDGQQWGKDIAPAGPSTTRFYLSLDTNPENMIRQLELPV
jgi:hypothetical protein